MINQPVAPHIISVHLAAWNMIPVLHGKKTAEWKWDLEPFLINTKSSYSFLNAPEVDFSYA